MKQGLFWLLWGGIGIVLIYIGNRLGLWWLTVLIGLITGWCLRSWRIKIGVSLLAAVGGWGLDLLWQARTMDIGGVGAVLAGILGIGENNGAVVIILTLFFAWLLYLSGMWVGSTLWNLVKALVTLTRFHRSRLFCARRSQ